MRKNKTRASSAAIGLMMLVSSVLPISSVFARTPGENENIYGTDAISLEYSKGAVFWFEGRSKMEKTFSSKITADNKCPDGITEPNDATGEREVKQAYCYNNTTRDTDVYYIVKNGAIMDGKLLDVLVYVWTSAGYWGSKVGAYSHIGLPSSNQTGVDNAENAIISMEYHFFTAGTAGTNNAREVSFKGVIGTTDLDEEEGVNIVRGYKQGYVSNPTDLNFTAPHTWIGSEQTTSATVFRAEVDGTVAEPLTVQYIVRRSLGTNFWATTKSVKYVVKGDLPAGFEQPEDGIAIQNGLYDPIKPEAIQGYAFDGWYLDEAMTKKAGDELMMFNDVTLYGKLTQNVSTVKYEVADAPDDYKKPDDATVAQNSTYTPEETPKIDGYNFDGWYLDKEMTKKADETITVDGDIILYGKFSKKAAPATPDTGINSRNTDPASSNQANLIIIAAVSLLSLSGIMLADRLYRRHRISKF